MGWTSPGLDTWTEKEGKLAPSPATAFRHEKSDNLAGDPTMYITHVTSEGSHKRISRDLIKRFNMLSSQKGTVLKAF
jgi:hypothetical protein